MDMYHLLLKKLFFYYFFNIVRLSLLKALSRKGSGFSDKNDRKLAYKAFLTIKHGGAKRQSLQKGLSMFLFFLLATNAQCVKIDTPTCAYMQCGNIDIDNGY